MRIDDTARPSSFGRLRFSDKVERCIAREGGRATSLRVAEWDEIERVLDAAAQCFPVAQPDAVRRIFDRNRYVFRAIDGAAAVGEVAMIAYLPLNEAGAERLLAGTLDGKQPDPALIVAPGEVPVAVYVWMTWTPGRLAAAMPRIAELFRSVAPDGCPLFSRAVDERSQRLHMAMGYRPAREVFAAAPPWLLVVLPEAEPAPRPVLAIRPVRTFEDMAMVVAIRSATYISEQYCLYSEEFDGNDFCATHLIGTIDGDAAGCIRMRYFGDFVKVERLAVRREYRRSRLAFRLVRDALALARAKGFTRFYGHARGDLVPFWAMFGFREVSGRGAFRFADVDYREMVLDGAKGDPRSIRLGADPMVTIRPEGAWGEPGPLERSNLRASRAALFRGAMKTVGGAPA